MKTIPGSQNALNALVLDKLELTLLWHDMGFIYVTIAALLCSGYIKRSA